MLYAMPVYRRSSWQDWNRGTGVVKSSGTRRNRRPCSYEVYLPDRLHGRQFLLDGDVAAEVTPTHRKRADRKPYRSDTWSPIRVNAPITQGRPTVAVFAVASMTPNPARSGQNLVANWGPA